MWDVDFLLDNVFCTFGDRVYQQELGVPMGFSCSPMLATLMLAAFEIEWLEKTVAAANGAPGSPVRTPEGEARLDAAGIDRHIVTLHVGPGTFLPVKADDTDDHRRFHAADHLGRHLLAAARRGRGRGHDRRNPAFAVVMAGRYLAVCRCLLACGDGHHR